MYNFKPEEVYGQSMSSYIRDKPQMDKMREKMLPIEGLEYLAMEEINKSALRRDLEKQKEGSPIRSRNAKLAEIGSIK